MVVQRSCLSKTSSDSLTMARMEVGISANGSVSSILRKLITM